MISSILGFLTGNASNIIKWMAALAIIALAGTVLNTFSEVGKARGEAKAAQTALKLQISETNDANEALSEVVDEYAKRDADYEAKALEAAKLRRRALFAERKLGSLVGSGDVAAINKRLCDILRSIEGIKGGSTETIGCEGGSSSHASSKYYKISEQSIVNMLANFERVSSYVNQTQ